MAHFGLFELMYFYDPLLLKRWIRLFAFFSILFSPLYGALGQTPKNFGKEFYLSFASNSTGSDYLVLYITSRNFTHGKVEIPALGYNKEFAAQPGKITSLYLPSLKGVSSAEIREPGVVKKGAGIIVTSDEDIAVFGLSHSMFSTDAFMGLPVTALGIEYKVLAYQTFSSKGAFGTLFRYPGEVLIVASHDSTRVSIIPSAQTITGDQKGIPYVVQLNRGDAYLIQSDTIAKEDLTGSIIRSTYPIAVFSGHSNTSIPDTATNNVNKPGTSDHLIEQIPSLSTWGNQVVVVPFISTQAKDLVRVLSSEDSNILTINGVQVAVLNAGEKYEITQLQGPAVIESSCPILVGQYVHSTLGNGREYPAFGDPAFTLVFPTDQFDSAYTIICPDDKAYPSSFVNLVVPLRGVSQVTIDDVLIGSENFVKIPASNFAYAQLTLSQGAHTIKAPIGLGVTVYGLGEFDSYAYPGGSLLKEIIPASYSFTDFDSTLLCQPQERILWIRNPNNVSSTVTSITIEENNPNIFTAEAILPLVIKGGDSIGIKIHFAPTSSGTFSGILKLFFASPKHQQIQVPLSGYATTIPLSFSTPHNIHILIGDDILIPIIPRFDFASLNVNKYRIALAYDPTFIQLDDIVTDNTLSYNSYFQLNGDAGRDTIAVEFFTLDSFDKTGNIPLTYLKFKSTPRTQNSFKFFSKERIEYSIIIDEASIGEGCLNKEYQAIEIFLDSTCSIPSLTTDPVPVQSAWIEQNYPNPSDAFTIFTFIIPSTLISTSKGYKYTDTQVDLKIFDSFGRLVANPINKLFTSGTYSFHLNTASLPEGVYFIDFTVKGESKVRKMIVQHP